MCEPKGVWRELLVFESHLPDGGSYDVYDGYAQMCLRCGELIDAPSWSGAFDSIDDRCVISGKFTPDGKVLLSIDAEKEWLKKHWEEVPLHFSLKIV